MTWVVTWLAVSEVLLFAEFIESEARMVLVGAIGLVTTHAFVRFCSWVAALSVRGPADERGNEALARDRRRAAIALSAGLLGLLLATAEALRALPLATLREIHPSLERLGPIQPRIPESTFEDVLLGLSVLNVLALSARAADRRRPAPAGGAGSGREKAHHRPPAPEAPARPTGRDDASAVKEPADGPAARSGATGHDG